MRRHILVHELGVVDYAQAHVLQERVRDARIAGEVPDTLLLLEHPPVITLGRTGKHSDIVGHQALLEARGVSVHETGRGGEVTLHAPGQLVGYPIVDLNPDRCDVRRYVRDLGQAMIDTAREHRVVDAHGELRPLDVKMQDAPYIGVWVNPDRPADFGEDPPRLAKLGAIGVRLSRWVTMHGFALNLSTDLSLFDLIVPCGIRERGVASLSSLGVVDPPSMQALGQRAARHLGRALDAEVELASAAATAELRARYGAPDA